MAMISKSAKQPMEGMSSAGYPSDKPIGDASRKPMLVQA